MKAAALSIALLSSIHAAEEIRMWTDPTGRMLRGTLKAKDATSATVNLDSGKTVKIPLEKLSKSDQEYVSKADLANPPRMIVTTVKSDQGEKTREFYNSNTGSRKNSYAGGSRTININVSGTAGKEFSFEVAWIGDDGDKGKYGVFKRVTQKIAVDGDTKVTAEFTNNSSKDFDADYRGYAVRLLDASGVEIARTASQKPFERFLDQPSSDK